MPTVANPELTDSTRWPAALSVGAVALIFAILVVTVVAAMSEHYSPHGQIKAAAAEYGISLTQEDALALENGIADGSTVPVRLGGDVIEAGVINVRGDGYTLVDASGHELLK